jgi:excinuclease ABC subunit A
MLLAPAIAERKGEHAELLEELQAGGFVRARIDGKVVELDQAPKLDVRRKHTVEAIVDRFKVRPDLAQRLAESFETALRLGQGVARVAYMDDRSAPNWCSPTNSPARLQLLLERTRAALFSFNSPIGACPTCDGIGTQEFFDPEKIVANPHLSLAGGAVRGWDRRNAYYFQLIQSLARHTKFDIEAPFESLPQKIKDLVLFGSEMSRSNSSTSTARAAPSSASTPSKASSKSGAALQGNRVGHGARRTGQVSLGARLPRLRRHALNRAARNVFVDGKSVPEVSSRSRWSAPSNSSASSSCPAGAAKSRSRSSRKSAIAWASWATSASAI